MVIIDNVGFGLLVNAQRMFRGVIPLFNKPNETEFQSLWSRCQAGDQDAQRELLDRYEEDLLRCVRVHLRDPSLRRIADSTDLCQSVMRRLIAGVDRYEFASYGKFQALVSQIVRSQVQKMRAKLINQRSAELGAAQQRAINLPPHDPARALQIEEIHQFVRNQLTADQWSVFESVTVQGMSYVEIAAKEGLSPDAIRHRVGRIKQFIRQQLGDDE